MVLPGKAGLDLAIVRSYSSKIWGRTDDTSTASLLAEEDGSVLGYGWTFHMGRLKNPNASGQPSSPCSADYPVFELPDGSARVFYPSTSTPGLFISRDYWVMQRSCASVTGGGACVWSTSGVRYELASANSWFYGAGTAFNATTPVWPVSRIVDRYGNQIQITYVTPNGNGAISSITDSYNRSITFSYATGTDGRRLTSMTANGATYQYGYTSYATPGGGTIAPRRFLTKVTPPAGPSYTYAYATTASVAANQFALSTLTYPRGGSLSYTYKTVPFYYGISGFTVPLAVVATRTVKDRGGATLGSWQYAYARPSSGMDTTTVTRPDGKNDVYTMFGFGASSAGNVWQIGLTQQVSRGSGTEVTSQTWTPGPAVANSMLSAPGYSVCAGAQPLIDTSIRPAQVTQRTITRDGISYSTSYQQYDAYGQPQSVSETGQQSRTTTWAFQYAPLDSDGATRLNLVRGLPTKQHVCVNGSNNCFDNAWTYNGPHYSRDTQTLTGVKTSFSFGTDGNLANVSTAMNGQTVTLSLTGYTYGIPTGLNFNSVYSVSQTAYWEGWLQSRTDGNGNKTSYNYDAIGRVTLVTPPLNPTTGYSYSSDGSTVTLTKGSYNKTTTLDGLGRTTATSDSVGVLTSTRYDYSKDANGSPTFVSYPYDSTGGEVGDAFQFDGLGRKVVHSKAYRPANATCDVTGACRVLYTYGSSSSCPSGPSVATQEERASGDTTSRVDCFAAFGSPDEARLVRTVMATGTGSAQWNYAYNAYGKLTNVTAPLSQGNRTLTYDPVTQFLLTETSAESGTTQYTVNEVGQPKTVTDARSVVTNYGYDALSRPKSISYSTGDDVTLAYDNANHVTSVSSKNGGTITHGYDGLYRVTSESWVFGGHTFSTGFTYDSSGCQTTVTYPSGLKLTQTCDAADRLASIAAGTSILVKNVAYHPSGQVKSMTYGDSQSTATTVTFDDRARAKNVSAGAGSTLALAYGYDGVDNVTSFGNGAIGGSSRTMTYDKLDRLLTATAPSLWGTAVYDYDALGNRILKSVGSYTSNYTYDSSNRLASATINTDVIAPMTFTWDAPGRLASSSDGTTYFYDGGGHRIEKVGPSQTTLYHYDPAGRVMAESTLPLGTKLRDFVYLGNKLIVVDGCVDGAPSSCTSTHQWYHTDALGSVVARTDSSGVVTARFDYEPWGEQYTVPAVQGDRQYNGRVYDPGTGFHDYGARMYWPAIGRFISADSYRGNIANPMSLNRYSYVLNNPCKYTDPSGHCPMCIGAAIGGAAGGIGGAIWAWQHGYSWKEGRFWGAVGVGAAGGAVVGGTLGLAAAAAGGGGGAAAATTALGGEAAVAPELIQQAEAAAPEMEAGATAFSRALTAADLGVEGNLSKLEGTFSIADKVAKVRVDMIEGSIKNPLQIVETLKRLAASHGAETLDIEGTLANPRLLKILTERYGATTNGANEFISIPLTAAQQGGGG